MLYQIIEDGEITQSYAMPDHDDTHHLVTSGSKEEITGVSADTTLGAGHFTVLVDAAGGAIVLTLPAAASHTHRIYNIKKIDASANTVTIDGSAAETIDGAPTLVIVGQWNSYTIQSSGTGWFIV